MSISPQIYINMLARAVKPNCDGLHDMAKQILIWVFHGKRKLHNQKNKFSNNYENGSFSAKRPRNSFGQSQNNFDSLEKINWDNVNLQKFTKNFYNPHPDTLNRPRKEIEAFWKENNIIIKGENCPAPIFTFEETGLSAKVINLMKELNYSEPTPIQKQGWPIALSGRNMVAVARTGSGKTLGFILPAIIHIQHQEPLGPNDGPIALVLGPTRELVQQTEKVTSELARRSNVQTVAVYGGSERYGQEKRLRRGAEICVATPGRLLDFLNMGTTNLRRCTYLVLDEADMMFDMGFEPQIRAIIEQIRPDRQVLMWSATWPKEIRTLAEEYLDDFIQINVGSLELTANPNIEQVVHVCDETDKKSLLKQILKDTSNKENRKTLIFVSTKKKVDHIVSWLQNCGYRSEGLHGGKTQRNRDYILHNFRVGKVPILVATDVAARGLDVSDIRYVINFDYPNNVEDYIHRIGRTARHNASGTAHVFVTDEDASKASALINVLKDVNQNVCPELESLARSAQPSKVNRWYGRGYPKSGFNHYNRNSYNKKKSW